MVRAEPVRLDNLDVQIKSIGTVTPLNTVTVRSRVNGVLERIAFEEGAAVEKGDLLAEIDPLPYRAQLEQAEGQLQQNRAKLENARADLELYEKLWEQDSIARQQLSDQRALVNEPTKHRWTMPVCNCPGRGSKPPFPENWACAAWIPATWSTAAMPKDW